MTRPASQTRRSFDRSPDRRAILHEGRLLGLTRSTELFLRDVDLDRRRLSLGIARATGKEPSDDELVHPLLVSIGVVRPGGRMDGRVCFVVLASVSRATEAAVLEAERRKKDS
jgi:hypothetical protein